VNTFAGVVLAWRPFLDPLNLHEYWWAFLVPLSLGIAVAYKAVRLRELGAAYWRAVVIMTAQIVLAMILLGAAMFVLLEFVIPRIV
jgi:hypothetical protein